MKKRNQNQARAAYRQLEEDHYERTGSDDFTDPEAVEAVRELAGLPKSDKTDLLVAGLDAIAHMPRDERDAAELRIREALETLP